ncbi:MAG: hypothetical protein JW969_04780 [Spirochaetales bacterium]|nr:hypothetical protein [Spirochaetales bacterium]
MKNIAKLTVLLIFTGILFIGTDLHADTRPVRLTFLAVENQSQDNRQDYLAGLIEGVLLYDLTRQDNLEVVERASLENVLREQELQLSSLVNNYDSAVRVGKILGADYLLKGTYVSLGNEIVVTITIVDVTTAKVAAYTGRGVKENFLHALAEKVVKNLTGKTVKLQSSEYERSIITLKDEQPGTVILYCNRPNAEVYLDGQFAGYTPVDPKEPFNIPDVKPGKHGVRVYAGKDWGILQLPEIRCLDWTDEIEVMAGKSLVLRAEVRMFYRLLSELGELLNERGRLEEGGPDKYTNRHELRFTDRQGKEIPVVLEISVIREKSGTAAEGVLSCDGKKNPCRFVCDDGKYDKFELNMEKVRLIIVLNAKYKYKEFQYKIERTDITPDIWKEDRADTGS